MAFRSESFLSGFSPRRIQCAKEITKGTLITAKEGHNIRASGLLSNGSNFVQVRDYAYILIYHW